jgi:hypothetical protein
MTGLRRGCKRLNAMALGNRTPAKKASQRPPEGLGWHSEFVNDSSCLAHDSILPNSVVNVSVFMVCSLNEK